MGFSPVKVNFRTSSTLKGFEGLLSRTRSEACSSLRDSSFLKSCFPYSFLNVVRAQFVISLSCCSSFSISSSFSKAVVTPDVSLTYFIHSSTSGIFFFLKRVVTKLS
uniref:Uncharacterized protein n=1 Tax=Saccharomyces cerevisiae TaxID=4932 RepID=E9PAC5_YEASX|nr:unknown product [Saccharomyces cerevisiae]